ncbi:loganic acid O-methyltransferase [Coffea arabica]|uniref:Loganic acid O-methyltransferase n=1 Tax=Coffea arabica TaxID=13443 RepID=A0A6P6X9Q9_COFAR|nr:probable S-adenosylmethionine-dependent methyltransferase At5g38100 [Coffea arabica]
MQVEPESDAMAGEHSVSEDPSSQSAMQFGEYKDSLVATISQHLDLKHHCTSSAAYRIADLGCFVGPHTLDAMRTITEAVKDKYKAGGQSFGIPEFFVYFNDRVTNDFNALFAKFPEDRQYFAAGVPGSFHGRLFPKASLDFVYCSKAVHWLSKVPEEELTDPNSPAYNPDRISYINAPTAVCDAYLGQFTKEMESILSARAQELIHGGLMVLVIPGRANGTQYPSFSQVFMPLETILLDLAKEGMVSKNKVDLFNVPMYFPSPEELKNIIIQKTAGFEIVELSTFTRSSLPVFPTEVLRGAFGGLLTKHFGTEVAEKVFDRYEKEIPTLRLRNPAEGNGVFIYVTIKFKKS